MGIRGKARDRTGWEGFHALPTCLAKCSTMRQDLLDDFLFFLLTVLTIVASGVGTYFYAKWFYGPC
jgi:hypothetical protein